MNAHDSSHAGCGTRNWRHEKHISFCVLCPRTHGTNITTPFTQIQVVVELEMQTPDKMSIQSRHKSYLSNAQEMASSRLRNRYRDGSCGTELYPRSWHFSCVRFCGLPISIENIHRRPKKSLQISSRDFRREAPTIPTLEISVDCGITNGKEAVELYCNVYPPSIRFRTSEGEDPEVPG